MAFPVNPFACSINPNSDECRESKRFFRELFEAMYIARFLPQLPIPRPIPDPPPFLGDPSPQPSLEAFHRVVSTELLVHALQDPTPTPMLKALKESNLQYDVAKNLLDQFETAVKGLKQELKQLGYPKFTHKKAQQLLGLSLYCLLFLHDSRFSSLRDGEVSIGYIKLNHDVSQCELKLLLGYRG